MNRPDNETGRNTFCALHDRADEMNAKWKFKSEFGQKYPRSFDFDLYGAAGEEAEESGDEIKKAPADEAEAEPELVDVEIIHPPYEERTFEKNGRTYNQKAEKIYNIEHIENFYGWDKWAKNTSKKLERFII